MNVSLCVIRMTTMIVSIGALGFTTYHTRLAQEEYYNPDRHGERPGQFIGAGAERLALCGTVSQDQFTSLLRGYHPSTGEPLRKSAGRRVKTCAWDIVPSASKSFAVAYALAEDDETRARLDRTFLASLEYLVERIEAATYIRVGICANLKTHRSCSSRLLGCGATTRPKTEPWV